jgi:hypothetical protein
MGEIGGNLEREPRLADATGTGEGQETDLVLKQQFADSLRLPLASDKRCERNREADGVLVRLRGIHDATASMYVMVLPTIVESVPVSRKPTAREKVGAKLRAVRR